MKKLIIPVLIYLITFFIYFGVATKFTFEPKWALDYFNQQADSILQGRLDIQSPSDTHDLSYFEGKWYAPWGVLSALPLIPVQLFLGRFVPTLYLSLFFSGLNAVLVYLFLSRLQNEFLPDFSDFHLACVLILFIFGTTHFYVGTLGSVWHVDQMTSVFFGNLGIYLIFKKNRRLPDYFFSLLAICISLLGRATIVLLGAVPFSLFFWDAVGIRRPTLKQILNKSSKEFLVIMLPLVLFSIIFLVYNYLRFHNPLEYGYRYINESLNLKDIRLSRGAFSFQNIPRNLHYMLFEIPKLSFSDKVKLGFDLNGNSIFFLTPPFLAAFLAIPFLRKKQKIIPDPYVLSLWLASLITIVPSLMVYSSGWMQFGYRYSLDITVPLLLLSVFGMKGRLTTLYLGGIIFSIFMYWLGINAMM